MTAAMVNPSEHERRCERLVSELLAGPPARSVEAVVGRVLAVQAQDARGFRLSVRSRSTGLLATDVDHALTTTRSAVGSPG